MDCPVTFLHGINGSMWNNAWVPVFPIPSSECMLQDYRVKNAKLAEELGVAMLRIGALEVSPFRYPREKERTR